MGNMTTADTVEKRSEITHQTIKCREERRKNCNDGDWSIVLQNEKVREKT